MCSALAAERLAPLRVPHHDVGVGTDAQVALRRPQPERARRRLRAQPHPVGGRDAPGGDALPHQAEPGLDAGQPAGDLGEVGPPVGTRASAGAPVGDGERAVVGGDGVHRAGRHAVPELFGVPRVAQRRRAHERLAVGPGRAARCRGRGTAGTSPRTRRRPRSRASRTAASAGADDRCTRYTDAPATSASEAARCDRLGLEDRRTGRGVLEHAGAPGGQRLAPERLDGAAVLAVQRDQPAVARRAPASRRRSRRRRPAAARGTPCRA